jgi:outer membrane lipoprotein-sorting protein
MKISVLGLALLTAAVMSCAASESADVYSALEHRLQTLKSLEIRYQIESGPAESTVEGRMVWVKPDHFFHDTPEWALAQNGGEQWRHLKAQNTLIRETVGDESELSPQHVLFNLKREFRPASMDVRDDGRRVLHLEALNKNLAGSATLIFPPDKSVPEVIEFVQPDGTTLRYQIVSWKENIKPDMTLFDAPAVPSENVIDFRGAGTGR